MCWIHVSIQFHLGLFCEFETDILRPLFRNRGKIDNHQMNIFISKRGDRDHEHYEQTPV